jgi:hypothetical protein
MRIAGGTKLGAAIRSEYIYMQYKTNFINGHVSHVSRNAISFNTFLLYLIHFTARFLSKNEGTKKVENIKKACEMSYFVVKCSTVMIDKR